MEGSGDESPPSPTPPPDSPDLDDPIESPESSSSQEAELVSLAAAASAAIGGVTIKKYKVAETIKQQRPERNEDGSVKFHHGEERYEVVSPKFAQARLRYLKHAIVLPFKESFIKRNTGFRLYRGKVILPSGLVDTRNVILFPEGFLYDLATGKAFEVTLQLHLESLTKDSLVKLNMYMEMIFPPPVSTLPGATSIYDNDDETQSLVDTEVTKDIIAEYEVFGHRELTTISFKNEGDKVYWMHCTTVPEGFSSESEDDDDDEEIPPRPGRSHAGCQTDACVPSRRNQVLAMRIPVMEQRTQEFERLSVQNNPTMVGAKTQTTNHMHLNEIHISKDQTLLVLQHTTFLFNESLAACPAYIVCRSGALTERHAILMPPIWPPDFPNDRHPLVGPMKKPMAAGFKVLDSILQEKPVKKDLGDPNITDWVVKASFEEVPPPQYSPTDSERRRAVPPVEEVLSSCKILIVKKLEVPSSPDEQPEMKLKCARKKKKSKKANESPTKKQRTGKKF